MIKSNQKFAAKAAAAIKDFVKVPTVEMTRSTFIQPHTHKTTFNGGDLVPIHIKEVLPGDTFKIDLAAVVRSSTPIAPVMDSAKLVISAFFTPNRLVMDDFQNFMGENTKDK